MPRSLQFDRWLFGCTLALAGIGVVMVFSASAMTAREQYGNAYAFLVRQLIWLALGLFGMFRLMNMDYRRLRQPKVIFTGLSLVVLSLLLVFLLDRSHATHRWVRLGPIGFQPSEFAKLAVILYLAWFLERRSNPRSAGINHPRRTLVPALGPVLMIAALVVAQPDLGTAVEIVMIAVAMLFLAGMSWVYLGMAGGAAVPVLGALIWFFPYRMHRFVSFLSPNADPQGGGFQLLQSLIAVGSGGLFGVGLMESKQKLFYLPEAHTDFIFAVLCEELGFIGGLAVLALFAVYGWRGVRAALGAPDRFGQLLALGITGMVLGQALINLSVVLGLLPTKGIPLPFISYGGSSLLVMLLATGVLLNISQHAE